MRIPPIILFAVLALLGVNSHAQQAARATEVSLAQVLEAARENLDVLLARRGLAAARADIVTANHPPVAVLSAKAGSIDLQNGIGGGNLLRDKRIDKSLGIDWTWERGNKRQARTLAAQAAADAVEADLNEVQVQQQLAAGSAFYDLLAAQERIAQVESIVRSANELAVTGERRMRAGDVSQQEAVRLQIEAQRSGADLRAAVADQQRASALLGQVTGLPQPLRAVAGWPALQSGLTPSEPELRPEVRAAQRRVIAARAALEGAQALRKHDLTIGSSFDHFPGTSNRQLELRVQMPLNGLFGGYYFEGEIARAAAQLEQADAQLEKALRNAAADGRRLQFDLEVGATRVRTYETSIVPQARQIAGMAELAYSKGAMSLTDLIEARRTLRNVLLEEIVARAEHARAFAAWQLRNAPAQP